MSLGVELLGPHDNSLFSFLRTDKMFYKVVPVNNVYEFQFLPHIFISVCFLSFGSSHANEWAVVFHCGFDLLFLMIADAEHLVMCLLLFIHLCVRTFVHFAHFVQMAKHLPKAGLKPIVE